MCHFTDSQMFLRGNVCISDFYLLSNLFTKKKYAGQFDFFVFSFSFNLAKGLIEKNESD